MNYEIYMARCIELAQTAEGRTSPNPMVGAMVVADNGAIIAEGYHRRCGEAHAEVEALDSAGDSARGATLFVSLEPCCHHGKTPPCSDKVIASGVKRVVCGMVDPNPKVGGGGIAALMAAGIEVISGVMENECRYLNRGFIKWVTTGRPWVALKMAVTLDAKIADRDGTSKWITGEASRRFVHGLRNAFDCVMVGGSTAQMDDAQLTVRDVPGSRNPWRAVIDTKLVLSQDSKLIKNPDGRTVIFCDKDVIAAKKSSYPESVRLIPTGLHNGHLDLKEVLAFLGQERMLSVLCEGGGRLASALLEHCDELYWIVAPKAINDAQSKQALPGETDHLLNDAPEFKLRAVKQLGPDVLMHYLR